MTTLKYITLALALMMAPAVGFSMTTWDVDGDGIENNHDNCPEVENADQANNDNDFWGDLCDEDDDNDGLSDLGEADYGTDPTNPDTDSDGVTDLHDCAPLDAEKRTYGDCFLTVGDDGDGNGGDDSGNGDGGNPTENPEPSPDTDGDGCSDAVEAGLGTDPHVVDTDEDGVNDCDDNCPIVPNPGQEQGTENINVGEACENDYDGDGIPDNEDNCIRVYNPAQLDSDMDGVGSVCDPDSELYNQPEPLLDIQGGGGATGCNFMATAGQTGNAWPFILMAMSSAGLISLRRKED